VSIGSLALIGNASGQTPGAERDPAQPKREVATVVEGLGQVVELGDAPPCQFCGSLMVRTGSCYRCRPVAVRAVARKVTNWSTTPGISGEKT
jgi:hypothetical protein